MQANKYAYKEVLFSFKSCSFPVSINISAHILWEVINHASKRGCHFIFPFFGYQIAIQTTEDLWAALSAFGLCCFLDWLKCSAGSMCSNMLCEILIHKIVLRFQIVADLLLCGFLIRGVLAIPRS